MVSYIIRRVLLIIPTLVGIMVINFLIIQSAPGGPVEQLIARIRGSGVMATERISGAGGETGPGGDGGGGDGVTARYRGAQGLDPELLRQIEKLYGFDKPLWKRFFIMMGNYFRFNFGNSFFRDRAVVDLVLEKMPVSVSLGLWTTFIVYFVSIPLGIRKAVRDGTRFDVTTSFAVTVGYAIPGFLFAILLIVLFAGGSYLKLFPLRGLV
ncbi:MAG: microcin ABC transporter permease, partial [Spirochaetota bacterium]